QRAGPACLSARADVLGLPHARRLLTALPRAARPGPDARQVSDASTAAGRGRGGPGLKSWSCSAARSLPAGGRANGPDGSSFAAELCSHLRLLGLLARERQRHRRCVDRGGHADRVVDVIFAEATVDDRLLVATDARLTVVDGADRQGEQLHVQLV